ncbi:Glycosyl transferase [Vibrio chagasii]|nr:Glycosyl transferase [Vibrio chagasii]
MLEKISVITCVYSGDQLEHVEASFSSILNQSFNNVDLLVYVDGPVEESVDEYLESLRENNNFFIFKSDVNSGLAFGLNRLIDYSVCSGYAYIARMDADDISSLYRIEKQVNFMRNNPEIDVLGASCKEFGATYALDKKSLPSSHEDLYKFSIARCPFIHPSVMFRTSVFESGYRYPTNTAFTEDMALWFILLKDGFKFANLDEVLLEYRLNENTIGRRIGYKKAVSEINLRIKYMFLLEQFSIRNTILISSRLFFHIMPKGVLKLLYKYLR